MAASCLLSRSVQQFGTRLSHCALSLQMPLSLSPCRGFISLVGPTVRAQPACVWMHLANAIQQWPVVTSTHRALWLQLNSYPRRVRQLHRSSYGHGQLVCECISPAKSNSDLWSHQRIGPSRFNFIHLLAEAAISIACHTGTAVRLFLFPVCGCNSCDVQEWHSPVAAPRPLLQLGSASPALPPRRRPLSRHRSWHVPTHDTHTAHTPTSARVMSDYALTGHTPRAAPGCAAACARAPPHHSLMGQDRALPI